MGNRSLRHLLVVHFFYGTEKEWKRKPLNKSVMSKMWTSFLAVSLKKPE